MTETESSLIAGCVQGDKAAWDGLVRQYSKLVYHTIRQTFALHHAEPRADCAADLFQELFHSLLRDDCKKLRQFKGANGCSLASWLHVIVARQTIDYLRKQSAERVVSLDSVAAPPAAEPEDGGEPDLGPALAAAMAMLPPRDQLLVELHFRRALAADKAAAALRISVGAFYTQKSRVLAKLRENLTKIPTL